VLPLSFNPFKEFSNETLARSDLPSSESQECLYIPHTTAFEGIRGIFKHNRLRTFCTNYLRSCFSFRGPYYLCCNTRCRKFCEIERRGLAVASVWIRSPSGTSCSCREGHSPRQCFFIWRRVRKTSPKVIESSNVVLKCIISSVVVAL
jgi:hypothetical protein